MQPETKLLEVKGLRAGYGETWAVHGIDFEVAAGGVTALLGANGAGKTTTLRAISGMVKTGGTIDFNGKSLVGMKTEAIAAAGIAHVPDGRGTFMELTVEENMKLGAYTRKGDQTAEFERMFAYFPKLKERFRQQAGLLSGGEQQMLAIARALLLKPKLLLLDEPSLGLAPLVVKLIFNAIRELNRMTGLTVLLVEQNAFQALRLAHRGYVLVNGQITMAGTGTDLLARPDIRAAYLEGGGH